MSDQLFENANFHGPGLEVSADRLLFARRGGPLILVRENGWQAKTDAQQGEASSELPWMSMSSKDARSCGFREGASFRGTTISASLCLGGQVFFVHLLHHLMAARQAAAAPE